MRILLTLLLCLLPICTVYSQTVNIPTPAQNKVDGLELPSDQTVNSDEGLIQIKAICKGTVKFLVVTGVKIKSVPQEDNSVIVSIPTQPTIFTIFAVGNVDGKLTDFARTNITVANSTATNNPPQDNPTQNGGPYHVTFIVDFNSVTPDLSNVLNSQNIKNAITSKNSFFRLYDSKSPILVQKKLDTILQSFNGNNIYVIQDKTGLVVDKGILPKTEQEILTILNKTLN